jgi:hypothetical protein
MRVIRNLYFWLILGTVVFVGAMAWSSSTHVSRQDREAREEEGESSDRLPPFAAGFATACVVGLFWFAVHCELNPPERKEKPSSKTDTED